ncbi:cadmium-translocating P-type ATPase [Carnobacterium divergens]|uniref:Cd(2+)-exporting ATPase n=1 Tax=Carnobacterium divergens TaxID=2748 RepID=A0AAW8RFE8_CARDV|nr:cation-translocating P-type ATPase [Carnobacterium divergens]MDT1957662.1 cadmium-translocating P-type ATPase [Carnobacterium divergens]MDT1974356.1 cadmium-translocating P-type ATPase [Carnobacterium divergens]
MKRYPVKGLDCADCTLRLETQINRLENGTDAKLNYTTSTLVASENLDLKAVEKILATENARLVAPVKNNQEEGNHGDHEHNHEDGNTKMVITKVIISVILLLIGIFVEDNGQTYFSLALYFVATVLSGWPTFKQGAKNLTRFTFNIDTLMTIALIGAFAIGEYREGTLVAILFGVNEWLEGLGMMQARKSMESLLNVQPKFAMRVKNGIEEKVSIDQLAIGDVVKVIAGEQIPSDGIVLKGTSSVNESAITGESVPVEKQIDATVFGGSINNDGTLFITLTKAYQDSALAKILNLVYEAQETKTQTELFINKFAKYYTPLIMLLAVLVMIVPPLFLGAEWMPWLYEGLAVLIIGCPCALVLSSPIALVAGITKSARIGILIKGGNHLETLGRLETIAFDKTGTLTEGKLAVSDVKVYRPEFYQISRLMEQESMHPIAKAIVGYTLENNSQEEEDSLQVEELVTVAGSGLAGKIKDTHYFLGNERQIPEELLTKEIKKDIEYFKENGRTLVITASETEVLGIFGLTDKIRNESKEIISELHQLGMKKVVMLTGDHEKIAESVANELGIDEVHSSLLPEQKLELIDELSIKGITAMVGDGVNDSPALVKSDLGIAMGKGTDSAIEVADVVLMQDHLGRLPDAIRIAKLVKKIIRINISIALGLKVIALLLTIPGWLTLWFAILADMGATILVTLISLTILLPMRKLGKK